MKKNIHFGGNGNPHIAINRSGMFRYSQVRCLNRCRLINGATLVPYFGPYFVVIFTYIGLKKRPYIW